MDNIPQLKVNEIFGPTIQGEGPSVGKPVVFLRLSTCNLACSWCDTPYTWNWIGSNFIHQDKFDPKIEIKMMNVGDVIQKLKEIGSGCKALVISGGEPLLQQQSLEILMTVLKEDGWWIEVETNGTIAPHETFLDLIDQINCSPKLTSSGPDNTFEKRFKPEALSKLAGSRKTHFKFVICSEQDMKEVQLLVDTFTMRSVYLMPEGRTKEEQLERSAAVSEMCMKYNFKFSPRLHIINWGTKRAV